MRDNTIDTSTSKTFAPQPSHNGDTSVVSSEDDNELQKHDMSDVEWQPDDAGEESDLESSELDEHADSSLDDRPMSQRTQQLKIYCPRLQVQACI